MWIFAQRGFLSIVQHRDKPSTLIVRRALKGDIGKYFPGAKVERTEDADYLYRAHLSKKAVAAAMSQAVQAIDYDRFKPAIENHDRRIRWYLQVWSVMDRMQEAAR
jgi:hypothetical protein